MLTSKQRAYLRSLANSIDTILIVGKGGISPEVLKQADDAIKAREIIKGKILETCEDSVREVSEKISAEIGADVVQVIGSKFILYRKNSENPVIKLPEKK